MGTSIIILKWGKVALIQEITLRRKHCTTELLTRGIGGGGVNGKSHQLIREVLVYLQVVAGLLS